MWRRGWCLIGIVLMLQACASAPPQAPLEEALRTYEERARNRFETGDLSAAAYNFERSVALAEMANDHASMVTNLLNLGGTLSLMGQQRDAETAYQRAVKLAALNDQTEMEIRALSGLAELAYRRGDLVGATAQYQQLLHHPDLVRHPMVDGAVRNGLALSAMAMGRLEQAERHIQVGESLMSSLTAAGQSATLLNRATLELRRGALSVAADAAESALAIDRESGYTPGIVADLELLGQIGRRQGNLGEARIYFGQALSLYQRLGLASDAKRVQLLLDSLSP